MRRNPRSDLYVCPQDAAQLHEFVRRAQQRGFYSICVVSCTAISAKDLSAIREEYADQLDILTVSEIDSPSELDDGFNFYIGAVKSIELGGVQIPFPTTYEEAYAARRLVGGYEYEILRSAYNALVALPQRTGCDAVRLFDPVALWNCGKRPLFDVDSIFYFNTEQNAFKKLITQNTVIELQVNGKGKGVLPITYPSLRTLRSIADQQGRVALASHANDPKDLAAAFSEAILQLRACGFGSIHIRQKGGWKQLPL